MSGLQCQQYVRNYAPYTLHLSSELTHAPFDSAQGALNELKPSLR